MKGPIFGRVFTALLLWVFHHAAGYAQSTNFVNFETAPVHPVSLNAEGTLLAVCNLPDGCVEFFDVRNGVPARAGRVYVGVDPVTARFNSRGELWVVNQISDSISIIDPARQMVVATLDTFDAPGDVVFTKNPFHAYVSHGGTANLIEVWDAETRESFATVDIDGDRPKAMAVSVDESEVYIAILESGNASTIIAPQITELTRPPMGTVLDLTEGPYGGANPFPNADGLFSPPINPAIPTTTLPPRVSLIVRKQNGRWLDDNDIDWSEFISGEKAYLTGRVPGWDIADHDLAILNTKNGSVRYAQGLMNICFDVAVNPATGNVSVIGTDSLNEVRFEPVLQSIFTRAKIASVNPRNLASSVRDLNPHLNYRTRNLPIAERKQSAGDPRAIAWNSRGARAYVVGMGSNNILALDADGNRDGAAVELPEGPTGLALDEAHNRLYVFCRFASQLVTLDAGTLQILAKLPLHDSTPAPIKAGRRHFYDTIQNSGLGQVSCASCHIDGRFDRLAWDLGSPAGDMISSISNRNYLPGLALTNHFHPMKGPMVTQTLQDIIGHEPFHWRGDRDGIEAFSPTFVALQGADAEPTPAEMQEFEDFLASITFPPNPFRTLDNFLPTTVLLPDSERAFGHAQLKAGQHMPNGNAQRGFSLFQTTSANGCITCHSLNTGLGPDARFLAGRWQNVPTGPHNEHHIAMVLKERDESLPFKVQQLRNLNEKMGFDLRGPISRSGFGFFHDGRVDTLTRFMQEGFDVTSDQDAADLIAFLLAMTGSDLPAPSVLDPNRVPGPPSRDVPAGVGLQVTIFTNLATSRLTFMQNLGKSATSRVDLIARGVKDGIPRSWLLVGSTFNSDRGAEKISMNQITAFASSTNPMTFTLVPRGSGVRLALDADGDGFLNQDEIDAGSDPFDATITPETTTPRLSSFARAGGAVRIEWLGKIRSNYMVQSRDAFRASSPWINQSDPIQIGVNPVSWSEPFDPAAPAKFYRIVYIP